MNSFVSYITAAAFVLHFGLGCCAHHAHLTEGNDCARHVHSTFECVGDHDDEPEYQFSVDDDPSTPASECHEGKCVFLAGAKAPLVDGLSQFVLSANMRGAESKVVAPSWGPSLWPDGEPPGLPVRRHLFHQLLLI